MLFIITANPTPQYKWYKDEIELKENLLTNSSIQIKNNGILLFEVCFIVCDYFFLNFSLLISICVTEV